MILQYFYEYLIDFMKKIVQIVAFEMYVCTYEYFLKIYLFNNNVFINDLLSIV
jgi:hypothetical protein